MANREDWKMLNDSLSNLGNSFVVNRQMQMQQDEHAADRALRERLMDEQVQQRRDAVESRNTPRVSAFISDPDNPDQGITVEGTLEGIKKISDDAMSKSGKAPVILPKPPTNKGIHRTYNLGGMTIHTYGEAESQKIEEGLRAKGIDPTAGKPSPGLTPVKTPGFTGALTPGGHYVRPDDEALSEPDKIKLAALYRQMSAIDKETRDLADKNSVKNTGRARALNTQRQQLQTQIDGFSKRGAGNIKPNVSTPGPAVGGAEDTTTVTMPAPSTGNRVRVISPDGSRGTLPAEQVQEALAAGYKIVK